MRAVVEEGLLLGIVGAVIGLFAGIGLAPALDGLFKAFGADLPDNGTVLEARTVIVSLGVGIVVTVAAGLLPALRATRVPPIAAMREGVQIPPRAPLSKRVLIIRFVLGLAVVLAISTLSKGIGVVLLIGLLIRAARLRYRLRHHGKPRNYRVVPALASAVGWLVSWRGITARLARENSVRQPGRTLTTALALTVGLGLVAFIAVLAAGTKTTIDQAVSRSFAGSLIVQNSQSGQGLPAAVAPAVRTVHGVGAVTAVAFTKGRVRNLAAAGAPVIAEKSTVTAIEPESFVKMYKTEWEHGSPATLTALGTGRHRDHEEVRERPRSACRATTVRADGLRPRGHAHGDGHRQGRSARPARQPHRPALARELGVRSTRRRSRLRLLRIGRQRRRSAPRHQLAAARRLPADPLADRGEYTHEVSGKVNKLLLLVYVLLALSVIVSLVGIVNTLILSIYERTRELGMMRAIGTSRSQIRQMIRYESLITAMIGGILGLVIGVVGAILVTIFALSGSGYVVSIPVGTLLVLLIAAALAGLIAAQAPARRAARLDVLQALASE